MTTTWVWLIVTKQGYYTGENFSNLIRDVKSTGFFYSQDVAKFYAKIILGLDDDNIKTCRIAL